MFLKCKRKQESNSIQKSVQISVYSVLHNVLDKDTFLFDISIYLSNYIDVIKPLSIPDWSEWHTFKFQHTKISTTFTKAPFIRCTIMFWLVNSSYGPAVMFRTELHTSCMQRLLDFCNPIVFPTRYFSLPSPMSLARTRTGLIKISIYAVLYKIHKTKVF